MGKIIFNTSFVTLNEYINAERSNKQWAARIKKEQTNKCQLLALASKHKLITEKVDIRFVWYKPDNRTDHDNISFAKKFCIDGIVKAGILKDDSPKYVGDFKDEFIVDKTRPYISCVVYFEPINTKT